MIERAEFGRTGHPTSRVIFGAAALGRMSQERADPLLDVLLEFGVNHLDTAAAYGDVAGGPPGQVLSRHQDR
jgi:aryl-alcohol dehydrogenase-like predicted oxidoreductase